jgi:hypothetical protein
MFDPLKDTMVSEGIGIDDEEGISLSYTTMSISGI